MTENRGFLRYLEEAGFSPYLTLRTRRAYPGDVILKKLRLLTAREVHTNMKTCTEITLLRRP